MADKQTSFIAFRLAPALRQRLEAAAKQDKANLSLTVRRMLQDGVERRIESTP